MVMKKPSQSVDDKRYIRIDSQNPFPGFYRARVELTRDPRKQGRVRVRIPQMHGFLPQEGGDPERFLHTSELPWAMPGDFSCAGYDYGQHMVPHVGTYVWVSFEAGDPDRPIYFGGIPYKEGGEDKMYGHIDDAPRKINQDHPDFMNHEMSPYYAGSDGSCPKEVYELDGTSRETTEDITRQVLYKSVKGHSIVADDTDEKESFTITDRAGQTLKFVSPMTKGANDKNKERRVIRTAYKEDTLHSNDSEVYEGKAVILLKDIDHQILRLTAENGKDKAELFSRDPELNRDCGTIYCSYEDGVSFTQVAEQNGSGNRVVVVGDADGSTMTLSIGQGGSEKSKVVISPDGVEIFTEGKLKVQANEKIEMHTEGELNMFANSGIRLESLSNIYIRGANIHLNDTSGGACEPYVAGSLPQQWEDAKDETFIVEG